MVRATDSGSASGPSASMSGGGPPPVQACTPTRTSPRQPSASPARSSRSAAGSEVIDTDRLVGEVVALGRGVDGRPDSQLLQNALLQLVGEIGVVGEERTRVLLALAELVALVGVPSAGLANQPRVDAHVDQAALTADAAAVHDVELRLLERRRHLVLHDLDPGAVADHVGAVLEGLDAADVEPDRGVELQ